MTWELLFLLTAIAVAAGYLALETIGDAITSRDEEEDQEEDSY